MKNKETIMVSHAQFTQVANQLNSGNDTSSLVLTAYNDFAAENQLAQVRKFDEDEIVQSFKNTTYKALYNAVTHDHFNRRDSYWYDKFGRVVTFSALEEVKSPLSGHDREKFIFWLCEDERYRRYDFFKDMPSLG